MNNDIMKTTVGCPPVANHETDSIIKSSNICFNIIRYLVSTQGVILGMTYIERKVSFNRGTQFKGHGL